MDRADADFRGALQRILLGILQGNDKDQGLLWSLRSAPDWEKHQRNLGRIEGVELALSEMNKLVRAMNGDEEPVRDRYERTMN